MTNDQVTRPPQRGDEPEMVFSTLKADLRHLNELGMAIEPRRAPEQSAGIDVAAAGSSTSFSIEGLIRLSISAPHEGIVEIASMHTGTTLLLPAGDVGLLIDGLQNLGRPDTSQKTISLESSEGLK